MGRYKFSPTSSIYPVKDGANFTLDGNSFQSGIVLMKKEFENFWFEWFRNCVCCPLIYCQVYSCVENIITNYIKLLCKRKMR